MMDNIIVFDKARLLNFSRGRQMFFVYIYLLFISTLVTCLNDFHSCVEMALRVSMSIFFSMMDNIINNNKTVFDKARLLNFLLRRQMFFF